MVLGRLCRAIFDRIVVALDKTAVRQTVLQFPRIPEQTEAKDSNDRQFACAFAVIGRAAAALNGP